MIDKQAFMIKLGDKPNMHFFFKYEGLYFLFFLNNILIFVFVLLAKLLLFYKITFRIKISELNIFINLLKGSILNFLTFGMSFHKMYKIKKE